MSDTTVDFEADPQEVAALLAGLHDDAWGGDPVPRYLEATRLEVLYRTAANAAAAERGRECARMWTGTAESGPPDPAGQHPDGLTYQQVAAALGLGTRSRAGQLIERGRALR